MKILRLSSRENVRFDTLVTLEYSNRERKYVYAISSLRAFHVTQFSHRWDEQNAYSTSSTTVFELSFRVQSAQICFLSERTKLFRKSFKYISDNPPLTVEGKLDSRGSVLNVD